MGCNEVWNPIHIFNTNSPNFRTCLIKMSVFELSKARVAFNAKIMDCCGPQSGCGVCFSFS